MAMKQLKHKHDAVLAPVSSDAMPPNYYLESNRPYAEQAGQLFAERTVRMMHDSMEREPSESTMQMYVKSGVDYYMNSWHASGRDIAQEVRSDVIRIGGHFREDMIDSRLQRYPEQLSTRYSKKDMLSMCEQDMFKDNVDRQVSTLMNMSVSKRSAAVSELYGKNGITVSPLMLQTMWHNEASAHDTVESQMVAQSSISNRRLPELGEELLNQSQAGMSADYGDYGE